MRVSNLLRLPSAGVLLLVATSASAGGLALPGAGPVVQSAGQGGWGGFYAGAQLGWGDAGIDLSDETRDALGELISDGLPGVDVSLDDIFGLHADGGFLGAHAGYNHDLGNSVIVGAELAYARLNIDLLDATATDGTDSVSLRVGFDDVLRVGGRVGYDGGRVMPFASAGFARATLGAEIEADGASDSLEETYNGFYFGGGFEFAVTERFSLGAEVLRHSFDVDEVDGLALSDVGLELDTAVTTIGLRASYRF